MPLGKKEKFRNTLMLIAVRVSRVLAAGILFGRLCLAAAVPTTARPANYLRGARLLFFREDNSEELVMNNNSISRPARWSLGL